MCHTQHNARNKMFTIWYLSKFVKYDTEGKDLLVTTLNEKDVSIKVKLLDILECTDFSIECENNVNAKIVIRKLNEYAFAM